MEKSVKVFAGEIQKQNINEQELTIIHYISTNTKDRYNEVMIPEGMDKTNFEKNPIVLFAHDSRSFPIAKSLWTVVDDNKTGIVAKTQFDKKSEVSREIFRLYAEGFLNAWSIGFMYKEPPERIGDTYYTKSWELLEYSAVPVPANPDALSLALKEVKNDAVRDAIMGTKEYQMKIAMKQEETLNEIDELKKSLTDLDSNFQESLKLLEKKTAEKLYKLTKNINELINRRC